MADLNPFDNNSSMDAGDVALAALTAIATRKASRFPINGILRPIDYVLNRDIVKGLKNDLYKTRAPRFLNDASAGNKLIRTVKSEDVSADYFPQNPALRSTVVGSDGKPFDVFEPRTGAAPELWDTVPRDSTVLVTPAGTMLPSQVARDILNFHEGKTLKFFNKNNAPMRGIVRKYTEAEVPTIADDVAQTMIENSQYPELAALQALRAEHPAGPIGQLQYIRRIRGGAADRKSLRKEVKQLARELDMPLERPAEAFAVVSPKTDVTGMRSRMSKVLTGEVRPEKELTNEGRTIKSLRENAMLNRALSRLYGEDVRTSVGLSQLPVKTSSLARGLAGNPEVVIDDADILKFMGGNVSDAVIANIRNNPVLMNQVRESLKAELSSGRIGDILSSTALSKDPFILQAILRGRV